MNINVTRQMNAKKYLYSTNPYSALKGEANHSFGIVPRKIKVFDGKKNIEIKQTNWTAGVFSLIPILNKKALAPFKYCVDGKCIGKSQTEVFEPVHFFYIDNYVYEIRAHSGNYVSVLKDDNQIALYKKEDISYGELISYHVEYKETADVSIADIFVFCIFIDVVFFRDNNSAAYFRKEKTFVLNDEYKDRIKWHP